MKIYYKLKWFVKILFNLKIVEKDDEDKEAEKKIDENFNKLSSKKIGRNEPCPCKSGKKYKHCHGAL